MKKKPNFFFIMYMYFVDIVSVKYHIIKNTKTYCFQILFNIFDKFIIFNILFT